MKLSDRVQTTSAYQVPVVLYSSHLMIPNVLPNDMLMFMFMLMLMLSYNLTACY